MRIPSYTITRSCHGKTAPFSLPFLRYGDARKQSAQRKAIAYARLPPAVAADLQRAEDLAPLQVAPSP